MQKSGIRNNCVSTKSGIKKTYILVKFTLKWILVIARIGFAREVNGNITETRLPDPCFGGTLFSHGFVLSVFLLYFCTRPRLRVILKVCLTLLTR